MVTHQQRRALHAINREADALLIRLEARRADLLARQRRTAARVAILGVVALGCLGLGVFAMAYWVQHLN